MHHVAGLVLVANPNPPWEINPQVIAIPYKVAAEDMSLRDGVLQVDVAGEDLARVKAGLLLP